MLLFFSFSLLEWHHSKTNELRNNIALPFFPFPPPPSIYIHRVQGETCVLDSGNPNAFKWGLSTSNVSRIKVRELLLYFKRHQLVATALNMIDLRREGPGSWGTITNPPSRVCSDHLESFLSSVHLGKKRPGGKASGNRVRKGWKGEQRAAVLG